jgi:pyridoxine kinase
MADNGELYKVFRPDFPAGMRKVCALADVIAPNMTEAELLLGLPYEEGPYTEAYIAKLLKGLSSLGPKQIVLTGVYFDHERLGAAAYDSSTDTVSYAFAGRIEGSYHGTEKCLQARCLAGVNVWTYGKRRALRWVFR